VPPKVFALIIIMFDTLTARFVPDNITFVVRMITYPHNFIFISGMTFVTFCHNSLLC